MIIAGEVKSDAYIDLDTTARDVIKNIGYNRSDLKFEAESCGILSALHEQSPDINQGVERADPEQQGAGDQGMMFGYATDETPLYIPLTTALSHALLKELSKIRREGSAFTYTDALGRVRCYLRPDSKSQVTVEYDQDRNPVRVHTVVISTQHDDFILPDEHRTKEEAEREMIETITNDVRRVLIPRTIAALPEHLRHFLDTDFILHVNPTGKFVIGGPHSQAARLSSTPTEATAPTAAAPSRAKTPRRSTVRLPTQPATSPRTLWPPEYAARRWCRWPTPSVWPAR